jgi:FMN phosphatase YigB (HAD superfamily)
MYKTKAVIYDLDDTILPTRSISESTFEPVFKAIRRANNGKLPDAELEKAFADLWCKPIDVVAKEYGFNQQMVDEFKRTLTETDYQLTLSTYDDFEVVKQINALRLLVTTGITKLQQAKIDALFNDDDFDDIIIDDPYHDNRLGKKKIFEMIAQRYQLKANQVWIVGDNPDSEIAAGNDLGMNTVQILRPGVEQSDKAKYIIRSFHELKDLITN